MWNPWQTLVKLRKSYPIGTLVSVGRLGEFPVVDYKVTKEKTTVVLTYGGYRIYQNVNV